MTELFTRRGDRVLFVSVRGEGPPFFFAHGLSGTHADTTWLHGISVGFRLITPDLYGRGRSASTGSVNGHRFGEHADDVAAILDELEAHEALVGGTSFGAAVAAAFAVRYPRRVRGLVLLASAFGARRDPMGEGDLERYRRLAERMENEGVRAVAEDEATRTGSTRPIERWTNHDEQSVVAFMRAVPSHRPFERAADLADVVCPALIYPGNDEIHTPELSASYASALPNATMVDPTTPLREAVGSFLGRFR